LPVVSWAASETVLNISKKYCLNVRKSLKTGELFLECNNSKNRDFSFLTGDY
jgi:hypothetical protein